MALPLPRVVADVGPGGPLVTSMRGMNALSQDMLNTKIKNVEAQYAPLTAQANAFSKIAYANLMGPQFMAKLMNNPDILANIPDDQKRALLQMLQNAGMNQFGRVGINQNPSPSPINQTIPPPSPSNPMANLSQRDQQGVNNLRPGQSYVIQGNQPQQNGQYGQNQPTFAENVGKYKGIVQEGQEAGKIRANDIKDLNDTVFNADTKLATLDDINDMISSPEIRQIRQLPLAGRHELAFYAKEGTPAQQQLVGRLYAQFGNVIKDSSRDFAGQFRKGEQQLLQGMKPTDSDTVDTMIGKAESLTVMTKLLRERAALTAQLMNKYHLNKGDALNLADKNIKGDLIRKQIHDKLNPTVTLRNPKTGEVVTIPISEARQGGYNG